MRRIPNSGDRRQETEGRRQETEGRRQETEGRRQEAEGRTHEAEFRRQSSKKAAAKIATALKKERRKLAKTSCRAG